MDTFTPEKRSEIMRRVKGKNTSVEKKLRQELWRKGVRGWRIYRKDIPGKPDLAFLRGKIAIFVDGCFWHGCPVCDRCPKSGNTYWDNKISKNKARDKANEERLREGGWKVVRFWEHEVMKDANSCVFIIRDILDKTDIN